MDPQVASYLWTALGLGGTLAVFLGLSILQQLVKNRTSGKVSLDWIQIASYAVTAVTAVNQIHSTRPDGLTDQEWNDKRFKAAEDMVVAYAQSLGITIDVPFLKAIRGLIEAAVKQTKSKNLSALLGESAKAVRDANKITLSVPSTP